MHSEFKKSKAKRKSFATATLLLASLVCFWQSFYGAFRFERDHAPALTQVKSTSMILGVEQKLASTTDLMKNYEPIAQRIETIRVGQRVWVDGSPDGERDLRFGEEVIQSQWRKMVLRCPKENGGFAKVEMLRPLLWLQERGVVNGGKVDIEVPECGIQGLADVLAVENCPTIEQGFGKTVTATFKHSAADIVDVSILGIEKAIGSTPNHPFWSETEQEFVRADLLRIGEQVRTLGKLSSVKGVMHSGHQRPVFNIEVHVDHVYHIGQEGVLVHNAKPCTKAFRSLNDDDIERLLKHQSVLAPGTRGGTKAMVDLVTSNARNTKFIAVTEKFSVVKAYGNPKNYIKFNPQKIPAGKYLSYQGLAKNKNFIKKGGLDKGWLDQQAHGLVVDEIPWEAIDEFYYNGIRIK